MNNTQALAYLLVRIHGMLLMFYSFYELTDLPYVFRMIRLAGGDQPYHSEAMQDLGILVVRFGISALFGLLLFLKTRRVIDYLMVENEPKEKEQEY